MSDDHPKKGKGGLKLGSKVWVRDIDVQNPDVFVLATLKGIAGKFAQIETEAGDKFETDLFFPANPPGQNQNDHTALLHLSDAALLANTKERYADDEIYTFVGPILVAVNPFKYIEKLYTPDLMAQCRKFPVGHPERPAHTFSMAEAAYNQMIKQKTSQSLVVSGESGAGKTEVNKQCMNYLVWRACDETSDLANRILESNPVLEGLGNAKTVRNNNSSRFGKFVTMRFDGNFKLVGAEVQTFLLEKSRVVSTTASGERNYHVFYHVLCGAGLMATDDPTQMRLLNRSGCTSIPRVDDVEEYHGIVKAMGDIGVTDEQNKEVQAAIAGILALGMLGTLRAPRLPAAACARQWPVVWPAGLLHKRSYGTMPPSSASYQCCPMPVPCATRQSGVWRRGERRTCVCLRPGGMRTGRIPPRHDTRQDGECAAEGDTQGVQVGVVPD